MATAAGLGVLLAWLAAGPLSFLHGFNVLLWTLTAIYIGKQRGGHVRKWMRLAVLGFAVGFFVTAFGYDGAASFAERIPVLTLFGIGSAICAVPSGGLIHAVFAWQAHRRSRRRH